MLNSGIRTGDFFCDTRVYLELFDRYMRRENCAKSRFGQHWQNIFDYLSFYVLANETRDISEWCAEIDTFIMEGFFRMDRAISRTQLESMCSSLHRFYMCMRDNAVITFEEYDKVIAVLRKNRKKWFEARQEREERLGDQPAYRRPTGAIGF